MRKPKREIPTHPDIIAIAASRTQLVKRELPEAVPVRAPRRGHGHRKGLRSDGTAHADRIAVAMRPGRWYARPDVLRATGLAYDTVKRIIVGMRNQGEVEQGELYAGGPRWRFAPNGAARGRETKFVFRLAAKGEVRRRRALMLA